MPNCANPKHNVKCDGPVFVEHPYYTVEDLNTGENLAYCSHPCMEKHRGKQKARPMKVFTGEQKRYSAQVVGVGAEFTGGARDDDADDDADEEDT